MIRQKLLAQYLATVPVWMCLLIASAPGNDPAKPVVAYPPLPEGFSSFGAAVAEGYVYVYGGHVGKTHTYSTAAVTGKFRRLNLANPSKGWEELPPGPALQGLALVAHGGKLYRIGGMQPRNRPGDPADNHSVATCAVFDPRVGTWESMPDLPAGRSSHDAVVVGDQIVVAGGWQMKGAGTKSTWHSTTLTLDLAQQSPKWESIPQPFTRRALNVAALNGRVYVVCGMNADNALEKTVDILELKTRTWSKGPNLPGLHRNGFTPAACTLGGKLYVSPADGTVYRLSARGDAWEEAGTVEKPRSVHRIVPAGDNVLLVIGGAGKGGNIAQVEAIKVAGTGHGPNPPAFGITQAVAARD
jgi:N-acetylneuraminic acid mutarotase